MATAKPGRDSDKFMLRLPDGMRKAIFDHSFENGRSMNAEVVTRLENSLIASDLEAQIIERQVKAEELAFLSDSLARRKDELQKEVQDLEIRIIELQAQMAALRSSFEPSKQGGELQDKKIIKSLKEELEIVMTRLLDERLGQATTRSVGSQK